MAVNSIIYVSCLIRCTNFFKTFFRLIYPFLKVSKLQWVVVAIVFTVDILFTAYLPTFAKNLLKETSVALSSTILSTVLLYGALILCNNVTKHILDIVFFPVVNNAIRDLKFHLCNHLHGIRLEEETNYSMPQVLSYISRISLSFRFIFKTIILMIVPTIVNFVISFVVLYKAGISLTFLLTWFAFSAFAIGFILYLYTKTRAKGWEQTDKTTKFTGNYLKNMEWGRLYKNGLNDHLKTHFNHEANCWFKINAMTNVVDIAKFVCVFFLTVPVFYSILTLIQNGSAKPHDFLFIQGHFGTLLIFINSFVLNVKQIYEGFTDIRAIVDVYDTTTKVEKNAISTDAMEALLELKNISFSYANTTIFANYNLIIYENESILLQGPSGAGKSTLTKIMLGLLMPQKGEVAHRGSVLYIPQEMQLFEESIRWHLMLGLNNQNISDDDLKSALKEVNLNFDLDMIVGRNVSGGEKNRILLAKAFLENHDIIILDEVLSNLPQQLGEEILQKLLARAKTVINISHRSFPATRTIFVDDAYRALSA